MGGLSGDLALWENEAFANEELGMRNQGMLLYEGKEQETGGGVVV